MTQVIADRKLMFSHLCQHSADRMSKGMPANTKDADFRKSRLDLLLEYGSKVQRLLSLVTMRWENKIPKLPVIALQPPFEQCSTYRLRWDDGTSRSCPTQVTMLLTN